MRLNTIVDLHEQANPTVEKFWEVVKQVKWTSDHNYTRIKYQFMRSFTKPQMDGLRRRLEQMTNNLDRKISNRVEGVGDDGYSDLLAHIVGTGKEAYDAVMADPSIAQDIIDRNQYKESFSYAFPYEDDWQLIDSSHLIKEAEKRLEELVRMTGSHSPIKSQASADTIKDMIRRLRIAVTGDFKKAIRGWDKESYSKWTAFANETNFDGHYGPPNLLNDIRDFITH